MILAVGHHFSVLAPGMELDLVHNWLRVELNQVLQPTDGQQVWLVERETSTRTHGKSGVLYAQVRDANVFRLTLLLQLHVKDC